jgi:mannose-6-phosphate isomerase-like protein (cupin superfamily)
MNPTMEFTQGEPLTEEQAIAHVESLGYHSLAFDDSHEVDEELHWHEFDSVAIVISGSGSFADETGAVTQVQPGCMVTAEAGWLHRTLAGTKTRVVLGSNTPYGEWSRPINKDPASRPQ